MAKKRQTKTTAKQPRLPGLEVTRAEFTKCRADIAALQEDLAKARVDLRTEVKDLLASVTAKEDKKQLKLLRDNYITDKAAATAVAIVDAEETVKLSTKNLDTARKALASFVVVDGYKMKLAEARCHLDVLVCDFADGERADLEPDVRPLAESDARLIKDAIPFDKAKGKPARK